MKRKNRIYILITLLAFIGLLTFGAWFFHHSENWSLVDSFYFTVMTVTTVGYGDFVPSHDMSKIVISIYSIITIPIVLFAFGVVAENYFEHRIKGLEHRMREIISQEEEIEEAIEDTEEKITISKKSAINE